MNAGVFALIFSLAGVVSLTGCSGSEPVASPRTGTEADAAAVTGRWDVTVSDPSGEYPSWFELERQGEALGGRFVGKDGSARPIAEARLEGTELYFRLPVQYEKSSSDLTFTGVLEGGTIHGKTSGTSGREVPFRAVKAPPLKREAPAEWGEAVALLEGSDLSGWRVRYPDAQNGWTLENGVLTNTPPGVDLVTVETYDDFSLHVEFNMPPKSNSGVYLRGRYEVQIQQDFGREPASRSCGSVYGFVTPRINASRPAGEWNSYDITLVGRRVTIVFNGETVIDGQEIPGPTGGALDSHEGEPGPIMLQGDHQAIQYRNISIRRPESGQSR